jgi:hypothetical protein
MEACVGERIHDTRATTARERAEGLTLSCNSRLYIRSTFMTIHRVLYIQARSIPGKVWISVFGKSKSNTVFGLTGGDNNDDDGVHEALISFSSGRQLALY